MGENSNFNIGENIKSIRKAKGLTQQDLATRMGIPQASVGRFENNGTTPKIDTLIKIANALEVELTNLIDPEFSKKAKNNVMLEELTKHFNCLNESGKEKAIDILELLTEVERLKE